MQDAYAGFVADVRKTYSKDYLAAQHALGVKVKCYKEWDKNDLIALYDSYFGKSVFLHLARLVSQAREEESLRRSGVDVLAFAQRDLNNLSPNGGWRAFEQMLMDAIDTIKATSMRINRDLAGLFDDVDAEVDEQLPSFDQQLALAQMDGITTLAGMRNRVAELRQAFSRSA